MIFRCIARLLHFFWKLVVPAPVGEHLRIDPNMKCPVCGARAGRLRCVERANDKNEVVTLCQHTCRVCGARFFNQPLVKVGPSLIHVAIARDELEEREDVIPLQQMLNPGPSLKPPPEPPVSKDKVN